MKRHLFIMAVLVAGGLFFLQRQESFSVLKHTMALNQVEVQSPQKPIAYLSGKACENALSRPIGVMLAGDPETRPLSGIGLADMVVEMPVSIDGITRFMAFFQCEKPDDIGSIRSARGPFIGIAKGYNAIFAHWGGEREALVQLKNGVVNNIDALANPHEAFYRKQGIAAPHNGFSSYDSLQKAASALGYATELQKNAARSLTFESGTRAKPDAQAKDITIPYRRGFDVAYHYDATVKSYLRKRAGAAEIDALTKKQVQAKNILIAFTKIHPSYSQYVTVELDGKRGNLKAFIDGKETDGFWEKNSFEAPLRFYTTQGKQLELEPGATWVQVVDENEKDRNNK